MVRCVVFVLVGTLLGACAKDPYVIAAAGAMSGNWRIERQLDRITGAPSSSAQLLTASSSNSSVPNTMPAGLQLTCFERKPLVRVSFNFKVGSDKDAIFGYRFDEKPGHDNVESRVLPGYQNLVIDDKAAVAQFVSELAGSNSLYLRIRSLTAGRTSAEFRLEGSAAAIAAGFADCPLAGSEPPARRTSS